MKRIIINIPDDAKDIVVSLASTPDDCLVICPRNIASGHTKRFKLQGLFFYPQLTFRQRRKKIKRLLKYLDRT